MPVPDTLFLPVKQVCSSPVVTCAPDESLVAVAARMREHGISGVVVCEGNTPAGIVTDRDLRNKVIAEGEDPRGLSVRKIMNAPLISVREGEFLFEALYLMSRHRIHRVGVVDSAGRLAGILTDSDVLRLQTRSPQQLIRDMEEASTIEELKVLHERVQGLVVHLVGTGVATSDLVRMVAHLNDRLLLRLITVLREERFPDLPEGFAFVVMGSEGRREQTLTTDQDNGIIYSDQLSAAEVQRLEAFSRVLFEALVAIGVPSCPGGIMAKNAEWRRSVKGWTKVLDHWFSNAVPENILKGSMFFDMRTLYGDPSLGTTLNQFIREHLRRDAAFLVRTAANVLRFKPPLGWFGRVKPDGKGEQGGFLDVKKAGIFAVTEGVKVLALEAGVLEGGTRERLQALVQEKILSRQQAADLAASFDFLVFLRLRSQVTAIGEGREPTNDLILDQLNRMEKGRLQLALEEVRTFQNFLRLHFGLDFIS